MKFAGGISRATDRSYAFCSACLFRFLGVT